MATPKQSTSSGIMLYTGAITGTLKMKLATVMGLALDGGEVLTLDLLTTGRQPLCAYEALLRSLGYRLHLVAKSPAPDVHKLPCDAEGYALLTASLPREIPLAEVSHDQVINAFRALAMVRRHRYADVSVMSLESLSTRVSAITLAKPKRFTAKTVRQALNVVPLLIAAHEGLAAYHLPLLCGYSKRFMNRFAKGGAETAIDRHVALYAHLGLHLRVSGPAGVVTITPAIQSLTSCLKASDAFRQRHLERSRQAAPPTPPKRKTVPGESSLSEEEICERLRTGVPPRTIAAAAKVSHQRIYFIAKKAGLGARQRKAKIASEAIMLIPRSPTP